MKKRACLLNTPVDLIDMQGAVDFLSKRLEEKTATQVVTINPEMISKSYNDEDLSKLMQEADLLVPDGIGVVLGLKLLGIKSTRVAGIELSYNLLKVAAQKGYSVGFLGADEDTIQKAKEEIQKDFPDLKIVFTRNGYFNQEDETDILNDLINTKPDILLVGIGFPKQEKLIQNFKKSLNHTIMIGVGGSFDVWSKKIKRAPIIYQKLGLEWFYRLLCQPQRFNRIFPSIPLFFIKILSNKNLSRKEY